MARASVLYLLQIQCPLPAEAQRGLHKSLVRLGLAHLYVSKHPSEAAPATQQQWARHLLQSVIPQLSIETTADPVPRNAPTETGLWVIGAEGLHHYLQSFAAGFQARDCDLVVVNTQKNQWRSLAF